MLDATDEGLAWEHKVGFTRRRGIVPWELVLACRADLEVSGRGAMCVVTFEVLPDHELVELRCSAKGRTATRAHTLVDDVAVRLPGDLLDVRW
jgi:hypothetical protein